MHPGTRELVSNIKDLDDEEVKEFFQIPDSHKNDANEVLRGRKRTIVTPDTKAGRRLIALSKNQRKRQRKARRKNR
jgi:hypothetical protein